MPMVSIIVPVYKVEELLPQCVDSILKQTFTDFELILVDDGSLDKCPILCDQYAEQDLRVRVIHQKNGGIAAARQAGLSIAVGKWIIFADSDDYFCGDELSSFLNTVDFSRTDTLYCFDYRNVWPDYVEDISHYPDREYQISTISDRIKFISSQASHDAMGYAVWDKLYSKELMDKFHIHPLERDKMHHKDDWAEDLALNLQYLMAVSRIVVSSRGVYGLRKHGNPNEQSDNGLAGRLDHMMDIFLEEKKTVSYQQSPEITDNFWKLLIWHFRRYFYLEVAINGIRSLDALHEKSYYPELQSYIRAAQKDWLDFKNRWDSTTAADYRYILDYILDRNLFKYKLKNYWLWKIKPHFK